MSESRVGAYHTGTDAPPPWYREPAFGQRLLARLVDAAVLVPVALIAGLVLEGRTGRAIAFAVAALYEVLLLGRRGQTLGKMAMGVRVVDGTSGDPPTRRRAATRYACLFAGPLAVLAVPAVGVLGTICTLVVLAPVLRPPLHLGLHDRAARTVVTSISP